MSNRITGLRALSALCAAGGVALAGAGCTSANTGASANAGASSGSGSGSDLLRQAAAKTSAASGARVSGHATLAGATGATRAALHVSDSGVVSFPRRTADMTVTVRGGPTLEVRLIGASVYERESGQSRWSRVSQASQSQSVATTLLTPGDPATLLTYLRYPASSVTRVGAQTIGGVPTTEYTATLHAAVGAGKLPIPLRVWIDHQGRVRQAVITVRTQATDSASSPSTRSVDSMNLTVDFTDFGLRPVITAPAT
jgi:hypothetical protein